MKKKNDISHERIKRWLTDSDKTALKPEEIAQTEDALLNFAKAHAEPPPARVRSKVLDRIGRLNDLKHKKKRTLQLANLPLLDENAYWVNWQDAVAGIEPPAEYEGVYLHTLESNEKRDLFVAWVQEYVPEEVHHDLLESFLILEGSCKCIITDEAGKSREERLGPGDFITMKIGETHDIRITSGHPAKAILQWLKVAA